MCFGIWFYRRLNFDFVTKFMEHDAKKYIFIVERLFFVGENENSRFKGEDQIIDVNLNLLSS